MVVQTRNLILAATATSVATGLHETGVITNIILTTPTFSATRSTTLSILDEDGNTIYTASAVARTTTTLISNLSVPCDNGFTVMATLNAADSDGGTVVVKLFTENRK